MGVPKKQAVEVKFPATITLLRSNQVAKILAIPDGTLRYWRCAGLGPPWVKLEGSIRYDLADVVNYVKQGRRTPSVRAFVEEHDVTL